MAAAATLSVFQFIAPRIGKRFLDPTSVTKDPDPYINREYARPTDEKETTAAA